MTNKQLISLLKSKSACMDAREWIGHKSAKTAWQKCERPDWLFWICEQVGVDRNQIVLTACACARLALPFVKAGEDRPRICIETTERWARGEATIEEVRIARSVADAAAATAAAAKYSTYAAAAYSYAAYSYAEYAATAAAAASYSYAEYAAATAAAADAAAAAADAAKYSTYAAAADAANYSTYAADAAASAAASAARQKMHQDCCAAIRRVIKFEDVLKLAKDL